MLQYKSQIKKTGQVLTCICRLLVVLMIPPFLSVIAWAEGFSDCNQHFYEATEPDYIEPKLLIQSEALCFHGFATLYSGISRTPLWSAEHLTRDRLSQADTLPREDSFHIESRIPSKKRSQLADYKGSGYDRGHLAPNADMANLNQQYDSFSLANIIPQVPENNRYVWRNIESMTRYLAKKHGEIYVITGVAFIGESVKALNGRVLVPTHVFKAIYIPKTGEAAAYYTPNDSTERIEVISLDELALRTGIDAFPAVSMEAKSTTLFLPVHIGEERERQSDLDSKETPLWLRLFIEVLHWVANNIISR